MEMSKTVGDVVCEYYEISRLQRVKEVGAGLGLEGTRGYELRGCYSCDGLRKDCVSYVSSLS